MLVTIVTRGPAWVWGLLIAWQAQGGLFTGRALGLRRLARPLRATIAGHASRPLA